MTVFENGMCSHFSCIAMLMQFQLSCVSNFSFTSLSSVNNHQYTYAPITSISPKDECLPLSLSDILKNRNSEGVLTEKAT